MQQSRMWGRQVASSDWVVEEEEEEGAEEAGRWRGEEDGEEQQ